MKKEKLKLKEETKTQHKETIILNEISKDNKVMKKDKLKNNGEEGMMKKGMVDEEIEYKKKYRL